jgi:transcriptional regulator with XRE-family HTH domain
MQQYSLKELRARKDVTQQEVAAAIGVSLPTYGAWEKDLSAASVSKLVALAEYFGVTVGEIKL